MAGTAGQGRHARPQAGTQARAQAHKRARGGGLAVLPASCWKLGSKMTAPPGSSYHRVSGSDPFADVYTVCHDDPSHPRMQIRTPTRPPHRSLCFLMCVCGAIPNISNCSWHLASRGRRVVGSAGWSSLHVCGILVHTLPRHPSTAVHT